MRITGPQFEQTLFSNENKITGRLDARFSGAAIDPLSEYADYDPMDSYIDAAFAATFNNYIRSDLGIGKGMKYKVYGDIHYGILNASRGLEFFQM